MNDGSNVKPEQGACSKKLGNQLGHKYRQIQSTVSTIKFQTKISLFVFEMLARYVTTRRGPVPNPSDFSLR